MNSLDDQADNHCTVGDCTLRGAINHANADLKYQIYAITFNPALTGTITLASELVVKREMAITGPGARKLTVSGNSAHRVLSISGFGGSLTGLTIRDGSVAAAPGTAAQGGGILCAGEYTINDCMFTGNQVVGENGSGGQGSAGADAQGGAIYVLSNHLILNGCTFTGNNTATGGNGIVSGGGPGGPGGRGQGGCIYIVTGGNLLMTNCTVSGGTATGGKGGNGTSFGGAGGAGSGGGVANAGTLVMQNCTVSGNTGAGGAGGTGNFTGVAGIGSGGVASLSGGTATLSNTICASNNRNNNGGADVDGAFISSGFNLISTADHSTGFTATGDQAGTDASPVSAGMVGPPFDTGGPTDTFAFFFTSRAIDAGNDGPALHRDQRGYFRTGRSDIGAYEYSGGLVGASTIARSGGDAVISTEVVQGKLYRLERRVNLSDSGWQTIAGVPDKTATGSDIEPFLDPNTFALRPRAFYHVVYVP